MAIPQLQAPNLGNATQDITGGIANFATGLAKEKERQRQVALENALLGVKMLEAQNKGGGVPKHVVINQPGVGLVHGLQFNDGRIEISTDPKGNPVPAPEAQVMVPMEGDGGELTMGYGSRYNPGTIHQSTLPPGQRPKETSPPVPAQIETPNGPAVAGFNRRKNTVTPAVGQGTGIVQPKAAEADVKRARDAFTVIQGRGEMKRALQMNPNAYGEVAQHVAALDIADGVPLAGDAIEAFIRQTQSGMSPAAAQYYSAMIHAAAAVAFGRGGTALTKNEIDYALSALSPKIGEDPGTSAERDRLWNGVVGTLIKGNPAWQRYKEAAMALGFNSDSVLNNIVPPALDQQPSGLNPRFNPRGVR